MDALWILLCFQHPWNYHAVLNYLSMNALPSKLCHSDRVYMDSRLRVLGPNVYHLRLVGEGGWLRVCESMPNVCGIHLAQALSSVSPCEPYPSDKAWKAVHS